MPPYELNKLGDGGFENLCQSLLKEIIGDGTITFGPGKDGAREATFSGKAPYPSLVDQWHGNWIFQVKFHNTFQVNVEKARQNVISDLDKELNKVIYKYKYNCDNYILITNVPLTSVNKSGNHDKITNAIVPNFTNHIRNIHVWGADDIYSFLDKYESIRHAYDLISAADFIKMVGILKNIPAASSPSCIEYDLENYLDVPEDEITRDTVVSNIAKRFKQDLTFQLVIGSKQTGKTNILSQFVRQYKQNSLAYFITASPLTQTQHAFLTSMCTQVGRLLGKSVDLQGIAFSALHSLSGELFRQLHKQSKAKKTHYFLIIDGLEWDLEGPKGSRILDLFPLADSTRFFTLASCLSEKTSLLTMLPKFHEVDETHWAFNRPDTLHYFKGLEDILNEDDIDHIHKKYNGNPGYLNIIKRSIQTARRFDINTLQADLAELFRGQIEMVLGSTTPIAISALEFAAVSPVPLQPNILAQIVQLDTSDLFEHLMRTHLIRYTPSHNRLEYKNEILREEFRNRLGEKRRHEITRALLAAVQAIAPYEELLLDLLQLQLDDYEGLKERLSIDTIVNTTSSSNTAFSSIMKRLSNAAELAQRHNDSNGLIRWTITSGILKSFIDQSLDNRDIVALISIGYVDEAIRRAYCMKDATTTIRYLCKAYVSMQAQEQLVSKEALDSLKSMVDALPVEELDKDIVQATAVDLFPLFPDSAISLLEKVLGQVEKQGLVESALETMNATQEQAKESFVAELKTKAATSGFDRVLSNRIKNFPYETLLLKLSKIDSAYAREYILRHWCINNPKNENSAEALLKWTETILEDRSFVVPLRSLRQISSIAVDLPKDRKVQIIEALHIPGFLSIDAPKEEWIRFRLNLLEAAFDLDPAKSELDLMNLYKDAKVITDLDTRVFALARILMTSDKLLKDNKILIHTFDVEFQRSFDELRAVSAHQYELTRDIISTLASFDPQRALIAASELNTQKRRQKAVYLTLRSSLENKPLEDLSDIINESLRILGEQDVNDGNNDLVRMLSVLCSDEIVLSKANLDALLEWAKRIVSPTWKSQSLTYLSSLYHYASLPHSLTEIAIDSWKAEDDIEAKTALAYEMVEHIAKYDIDAAKRLYEEAKSMREKHQAGLEFGELGNYYNCLLDVLLRSIDEQFLSGDRATVHQLELSIDSMQSTLNKVLMYAGLASSAYRSGTSLYADELVRTKIIPSINAIPVELNRDIAIFNCFPILFQYDPVQANDIIKSKPQSCIDLATYFAIIWGLCKCFLGDLTELEQDFQEQPGLKVDLRLNSTTYN